MAWSSTSGIQLRTDTYLPAVMPAWIYSIEGMTHVTTPGGTHSVYNIYLRTVPHTGTRFVLAFLEYLGVKNQQWHIGWPPPHSYIQFDDKRVSLDNVPRTPDTRYIVTARNPYHTFESLEFDLKAHPGRAWTGTCQEWYDELIDLYGSNALVHVLPLDTQDQQQALTELAEFCGVEYDGGFTWEATEPSGCEHGDIPESVRKELSGAYQWYEDQHVMRND